MNQTEFKTLADNYFTLKMREYGWHGTYQNFRKLDRKHVVKMFGVHKSVKEDTFICNLGLDFDLSDEFPKRISKSLNNSNCLFLNTITPSGVSDQGYHWMLSDDENENKNLLETLWESITRHGDEFYAKFDNFPKPFDTIAPSEFEDDKSVKLLNQYYVWDQIGFMRLLKDINLFLDQRSIAKQFSEIAISRVHKTIALKILPPNKTEEKYFKNLLKSLAV